MTIKNQEMIPFVDQWIPNQDDIIFTCGKNIIVAPLNRYYHLEDGNERINLFMVNPKKSYNSDDLRSHNVLYLNYFEKYFDNEKEYFSNIAYIKFLIDCYPEYDDKNFINDISRYILQKIIYVKVGNMVNYNYSLSLSYKNMNNPQLQYTDKHARILMFVSILMNLCIPLVTHFAYMRRIPDIDEFILDVFDLILYDPIFQQVNIVSKLYETSISNVNKNEKNNMGLWIRQDIRGKDTVTHSMDAVRNIIINIMPKYKFDENMVSLNHTSIQKSNKFQITDISYDYSYIPLSSIKKDGDENSSSEFDKFESNLIKTNEAVYLQSKVNCQFSINKIEAQWGPYDEKEIGFYLKELRNENGEIINGFQKQLIFNLFYKYFGDTVSINAINSIDYIKLMITARKMLKNSMMVFLPYIISSKVEKVVARKTLNKKEFARMEASQYYPLVRDKYKNDKIIKQILGTAATIITSTFKIIDFIDKELNGKQIIIEPDIIIEEILLYILLI